MAYNLQAWIDCKSEEQANILLTLLSRDTRPVFPEDVIIEQQELFNEIELIEFPDELQQQGQFLWVWWHDYKDIDVTFLNPILNTTNSVIALAFEVPNNPMSGDTDEDETQGWFYVQEADEYIRLDKNQVEARFDRKLIERFIPYRNDLD